MNIIYLECKLLDITKHGFDFIQMSVFNQILIDNIRFITFVRQIEGCGGLICRQQGLGCPLGYALLGVKTAEVGMAAAAVAGGGALCFLLCSIRE
jgi:hypothetical protein